MQQLPDVVRVLGVPVVAGPGHTVSPGLWPLQHQAALHSLQHLQGLGARQPQGPLHKLGVPTRNWSGQSQDYTVAPRVGSRTTPLSAWKASPDPKRYEAQALMDLFEVCLVLGVTVVRKAHRMACLVGRGWGEGAFGCLREVLVDVFCWLFKETFKLIPSPL